MSASCHFPIIKDAFFQRELEITEIGVVTPYVAQVRLLKRSTVDVQMPCTAVIFARDVAQNNFYNLYRLYRIQIFRKLAHFQLLLDISTIVFPWVWFAVFSLFARMCKQVIPEGMDPELLEHLFTRNCWVRGLHNSCHVTHTLGAIIGHVFKRKPLWNWPSVCVDGWSTFLLSYCWFNASPLSDMAVSTVFYFNLIIYIFYIPCIGHARTSIIQTVCSAHVLTVSRVQILWDGSLDKVYQHNGTQCLHACHVQFFYVTLLDFIGFSHWLHAFAHAHG